MPGGWVARLDCDINAKLSRARLSWSLINGTKFGNTEIQTKQKNIYTISIKNSNTGARI